MMCLILQETCCLSQVLKPWRLNQETSEEGLFIKARQIPNSCSTDSYLSRFNESQQLTWQILSIEVSTAAWHILSIENYENQFFRSDFQPMLMYLCRVSFLTTLEIYIYIYIYMRLILKAIIEDNTRRTHAKGDRCLILSEWRVCVRIDFIVFNKWVWVEWFMTSLISHLFVVVLSRIAKWGDC